MFYRSHDPSNMSASFHYHQLQALFNANLHVFFSRAVLNNVPISGGGVALDGVLKGTGCAEGV